jgi:hypothetical protein
MAGMYEGDQPMKIAELGDTIYIAESEKTPFTRLLKRGKRPAQMLAEWPVQLYPRQGFDGSVDGTDKAAFDHTTREKMEGFGMWLMSEGWMVSKLANLTEAAGVGRNEKAKQIKDDSLLLAQKHERQVLSAVDLRAEARPSTAYRSRGAFSWLANSAQAVTPVPTNFRPASACIYTGALASFAPSSLEAMLEAAATAKRGPVDLTCFGGIKLKSQMSTWAQKVTLSSNEVALQQFNLAAEEKRLQNVVDVFEFDAGRVKVVPSFYLACNEADGADTEYTPRSGVFLDMDMWELAWLKSPANTNLAADGSGVNGFIDAVAGLKCFNPRGQGKVYSNS